MTDLLFMMPAFTAGINHLIHQSLKRAWPVVQTSATSLRIPRRS
jgi:hypothetical protein